MIKLVLRRTFLFLLSATLVAATLGAFHPKSVKGDWDYMCNAWEESCEEGGTGGPGGGNGSGGDNGHYCAVPSVTVNGVTCTASGCKVYSSAHPVFVCDYRTTGGTSAGCPPLEQCN
jgi:hypothetical protein